MKPVSNWLVTVFTGLVAVFTGCLFFVGLLQWSTLQNTEETQRASIRAFVHIEKFERAKYPTNDKRRFAVTAFVTNTGNTPAPFVQMRFACLNSQKGKVAMKKRYTAWFAAPLKKEDKEPIFVAPKQVLPLQACEFTAEQVDQSRQGRAATIVVSEVRYTDGLNADTLTLIRMVQWLRFDDSYDPDKKGGYSFAYADICFNAKCVGYDKIKRLQ